jgi:hypothetical protein
LDNGYERTIFNTWMLFPLVKHSKWVGPKYNTSVDDDDDDDENIGKYIYLRRISSGRTDQLVKEEASIGTRMVILLSLRDNTTNNGHG